MNSEKIKGFLLLRKSVDVDPNIKLEDRDFLLNAIDEMVRGMELLDREDKYLEQGFYLGYLLIAVQRIENAISNAILGAEELQARKNGRPKRNINLNVPFGILLSELSKYIESEEVMTELRKFKDYRDGVVHGLYKDYSRTLEDIESRIIKEYPKEKIIRLQAMVTKVSAAVSRQITLDNKEAIQFVDLLIKRVDEISEGVNPNIKVL